MHIKDFNSFNTIIFTGFSFRILFLIFLLIFPIYHIELGYITPFTYYRDIADIEWYERFFLIFQSSNNGELNFVLAYKNQLSDLFAGVLNRDDYSTPLLFPGPIFPLIIKFTFYARDNTYFLFLIIFISEFISFYLWQLFYIKKNLNIFFRYVFCFFPIPLVFAFIHTSDTIFFIFFTFFIYFLTINY